MKNIKTKLASLLLLFSLGFFSSSFYNSPLSEAGSFCEGLLKGDLTNDGGVEDFCDGAEDSGGSSTLSFSQYQLDGDLGELSTEGLSTSLTSAGGNLKDFILTIVDFALGFLGLIAVLIVIYGGVLYVTAGGETERTDKGKKAIMYATVGLLIVLGSFAFVNTVIQGGTGGEENGAGGGATGSGGARRNSTSFNAAAVQVQAIGQKIFDGFEFLADVTEELKSIKADAEKPSLDPQNFPPKGEILSYLSSVKGKLQRIESQLATFSEAEAVVKDLIRDIDYEMDRINVLTDQKYINRNDWTDMCDPTGKEDESDCREKENFEPYIVGLAERWEEIRNVYFLNEEKATDTDYDRLTPILEPIANDYKRRLIGADETFNVLDSSPGYIGQLVEIWDFVSVVDAVGIGEGAASFRNMMAEFGYDYQATTDTFDTNDSPNSLVWNVDNWLIDIDVSTAAQPLIAALRHQIDFVDALEEIDFVDARLTASVTEGRAPLTVTFDVLGTQDPAGGTLAGEISEGERDLIEWDLAGDKIGELLETGDATRVNENAAAHSGLLDDENKAVECTFIDDNGIDDNGEEVSDKDAILRTSYRCTYNYPGVYRAAVKINSRDPSQYAPGIAVVPIIVRPPNTEINLCVTTGLLCAGDEDYVSKYDDAGVLTLDRREISFTLEEASTGSGLRFKADTSNPQPNSYSWDFGDGERSEEPNPTHIYDETGKYKVTLEVANDAGVEDTKTFYVNITNLVARINVADDPYFINSPIVFNGTASRADVGTIREYEWEIYKDGVILSGYPKAGPDLAILTHEFEDAGIYEIRLQVTSNLDDEPAQTSITIQVQSKPPIAQFDYVSKDANQPGTVHFDADRSYDPDDFELDGIEDFEDPLTYAWTISPGVAGTDWKYVEDTTATSKRPVVKFLTEGTYDVTLTVESDGEFGDISRDIVIDDVVDIAWAKDQVTTKLLGQDGEENQVDMTFNLVSDYAKKHSLAFDIDFGDGNTDGGNFTSAGTASITHTYRQAGKYSVQVTVYDENDDDKTILRRFFIGNDDKPLAKISVLVGGDDYAQLYDGTNPIELNRSDNIKFDAAESKNTDGTSRDLRYSWNFGDTEQSTQRSVTHSYDELSPPDGYYTIKLRVYDKDDPTVFDEDEIRIDIVSEAPHFASIQAVPVGTNPKLITPVEVDVRAYEANDPDGEITQYRWWYYDPDDPEDELGVQITNGPSARLVIGTDGKEGLKRTYAFALEVTDSDNRTFSTEELYEDLDEDSIPTIRVENGPNELPQAKFNVDQSKVFVGETINLTSASTDPDGKIVSYIWDVEGDGFYNNYPTNKASIEHIYTEKNLQGYDVKLKVIDDKGAQAISQPVTVFVDSKADDPTAAFRYEVLNGFDGRKIKFSNNSKADTSGGAKIVRYEWDFDTTSAFPGADSDGDGLKNNDIDSKAENPEFLYANPGTYTVRLRVTDNQGNTDEVTNTLRVPLAKPPVAAFTYQVRDGKVYFANNSSADSAANAKIFRYVWDFDTSSSLPTADTDGDGNKANDRDSAAKDPSYQYSSNGTYFVKLTVIDDQGNTDDVTNPVQFNIIPDSARPGTVPPGGNTNDDLKPVLSTSPAPGVDNAIHLKKPAGEVTFNFSKSLGPISTYSFDKNIYFDTGGNGVTNDDIDFKTAFPGTWKTSFDSSWGRIVVKLTVEDIYGNKESTTVEIKFD